jgi:VanZ family protein
MRSLVVEEPGLATAKAPATAAGLLWAWWPVGVACLVIVFESTRLMGADNTSRWLRPHFEWLFGHFGDRPWNELHHLIRKSGHFLGYGLVALTFLRAWLLSLGPRLPETLRRFHWRSTWRAILGAALVASSDELHQSYLANRTGTPWDVLLDTCGAATMCLAVWLALNWFRNPSASSHNERVT